MRIEWQKDTTEVNNGSGYSGKIPAEVCRRYVNRLPLPGFAVHREVKFGVTVELLKDSDWVVTQQRTGKMIACYKTRKAARRAAEELMALGVDKWEKDETDKMTAKKRTQLLRVRFAYEGWAK